ncbi:MAG: type II secretion system protein GspG [Verrucomicrobiota bacterium]|jgi:hypothetical protein
MKEYNLKQSVVIVVAGFALLWACLYCFVFPFLVGGGPTKVPRAQMDERHLAWGMEQYKLAFDSYPTGENTIFVRMLAGNNPTKLKLINLSVHSTNENGEFIDPWGTPYKIISSHTNRVTIFSAGIDKIFGDKDDIIFNSASNDYVKP